MGGNDQWGNIVAGIDLIRRKAGKDAYAITFPLLTTASGAKMGKTAAGAVWLSPEKTSPFDFYQFWVNTDDRDVARFLKLYTLLPVEEIAVVEGLEGQGLNICKTILAYEATAMTHGREQALAALEAASSVFGRRQLPPDLLPSSSIPRDTEGESQAIPTTILSLDRLKDGIPVVELFAEVGLCASRGAARRLIQQGGAYLNDDRLNDTETRVDAEFKLEDGILLKAGKKKIHRVRFQ
jgi:tyrosyl-tRNA synthetase